MYVLFTILKKMPLHAIITITNLHLLCYPTAEIIFWEIMRLRREMSVAKLGFYAIES